MFKTIVKNLKERLKRNTKREVQEYSKEEFAKELEKELKQELCQHAETYIKNGGAYELCKHKICKCCGKDLEKIKLEPSELQTRIAMIRCR